MICQLAYLLNEVVVRDVKVREDKTEKCMNNRVSFLASAGKITYVNITAWGSVAEKFQKYKKGDQIFFTGELIVQKRKFGDREIEQHYIQVEKVLLAGNKNDPKTTKKEIEEVPPQNVELDAEIIIPDSF